MHKVGTSYTMYFNIKNQRTGNLFNKPFRSRHVGKEQHFRHLPNYIHLNAAEVFDSNWKLGKIRSHDTIERKLKQYRFSSFLDYCGAKRPENAILSDECVRVLNETMTAPGTLVEEAAAYYSNLELSKGVTERRRLSVGETRSSCL